MPLLEAIPALLDLTAKLTTSLSPKGQRLVLHPGYTGPVDLNPPRQILTQTRQALHREARPLPTAPGLPGLGYHFLRLLRADEQTDDAIGEALRTGALKEQYQEVESGCCAHCRWDPAAVIPAGFAEMESLYFYAKEHRLYWGIEVARGERVSFPNSVEKRYYLASREQVEDAIRRLRQPN